MRKTVGKFTLGIVLLAFGLALALDAYAGTSATRQALAKWWPLAIVLLGLEYILASRDPEADVRLSGASVLLTVLVLAFLWTGGAGHCRIGSVRIGGFGHSGGFGIVGTKKHFREARVNEAFGTDVATLEVHAVGDVIVTGSDTGSVTGTALVTVEAGSAEEARKYAEQVELKSSRLGDTLRLEVERTDSLPKFVGFSPSFTLTVPARANLSIQTVSGTVEVKGVTGRVKLATVSGGVVVDHKPSGVDADLVSGAFAGKLGAGMKDLSVKTVSGSVSIEVPEGTGGTVSATTVSGSISDALGKLSITKSPGRHRGSGSLGKGATDIDVDTVSGSVTFK